MSISNLPAYPIRARKCGSKSTLQVVANLFPSAVKSSPSGVQKKGHWRERTDKDYVEDWEEYGNETGDVFICDQGDAFNLSVSVR